MKNARIENRIQQLEQKADIAPPLIVVMWQPPVSRLSLEEQEGRTLKILHSEDPGRKEKGDEKQV